MQRGILPTCDPLIATGSTPQELSALAFVVVVAGMGAVALIALGIACRRTKDTTLFAPLVWAAVSLTILFLAIARTAHSASTIWNDKWWLVASTSTLCPLVALLGAKRPQNWMWQFVVISFWGIVSMPAIESLIVSPSEPLEIHAIWKWLFAILIVMGCVNYGPTSCGLAGLMVGFSQVIILWPFLPGISWIRGVEPRTGVPLLAASICFAALNVKWRRKIPAMTMPGWNRVWLDFRDFYGLVWGVRVQQRIETLLDSEGPVWLDWDGIRTPLSPSEYDSEHSPLHQSHSTLKNAEPALRSLLLRFVSNDWINRRLPPADALPPITA